MTLKSFHVVFISCSSALSFLFGVWILGNPEFTGTASDRRGRRVRGRPGPDRLRGLVLRYSRRQP